MPRQTDGGLLWQPRGISHGFNVLVATFFIDRGAWTAAEGWRHRVAEVIDWTDGRSVVVEFGDEVRRQDEALARIRETLDEVREPAGLAVPLTAAVSPLGLRAEVKYSPTAPYAPAEPIEVRISPFPLDGAG